MRRILFAVCVLIATSAAFALTVSRNMMRSVESKQCGELDDDASPAELRFVRYSVCVIASTLGSAAACEYHAPRWNVVMTSCVTDERVTVM